MALYALKQALRVWYSKIKAYLSKKVLKGAYVNIDDSQSERNYLKILIVSLYVDDLIYT